MLSRNGRLVSGSNADVAEKRFFEAWYRRSTVSCTNAGSARGSRRSLHAVSPRNSGLSSPPKARRINHRPNVDHKHPTSISLYMKRAVTSERSTNISGPKLADGVRNMMRSVPNPVVVLTCSDAPPPADFNTPPSSPDPDETEVSFYRGMTLSSFSTLTLSPTPYVTFNIQHRSRTLSALSSTRYFNIHILEANAEGAALAAAFARANPLLQTMQWSFWRASRRGELESTWVSEGGRPVCKLPVLQGRGVKFGLRCKVLGEGERPGGGLIEVGDHVMVIARVCEMPTFESAVSGMGGGEKRAALSYAFGKYGCFESLKEMPGALDAAEVEDTRSKSETTRG